MVDRIEGQLAALAGVELVLLGRLIELAPDHFAQRVDGGPPAELAAGDQVGAGTGPAVDAGLAERDAIPEPAPLSFELQVVGAGVSRRGVDTEWIDAGLPTEKVVITVVETDVEILRRLMGVVDGDMDAVTGGDLETVPVDRGGGAVDEPGEDSAEGHLCCLRLIAGGRIAHAWGAAAEAVELVLTVLIDAVDDVATVVQVNNHGVYVCWGGEQGFIIAGNQPGRCSGGVPVLLRPDYLAAVIDGRGAVVKGAARDRHRERSSRCQLVNLVRGGGAVADEDYVPQVVDFRIVVVACVVCQLAAQVGVDLALTGWVPLGPDHFAAVVAIVAAKPGLAGRQSDRLTGDGPLQKITVLEVDVDILGPDQVPQVI